MKQNKIIKLGLLAGFLAPTCNPLSAETIAFWDFEDGTDGASFTPSGNPNGSGGSFDTANNIFMRGWDIINGPTFTTPTSPNGGNLAMNNAGNSQDGYVTEGALHNWSPTAWTIETHVYLDEIAGWETLIGRDGSTVAQAESDFYLVNNGIDDKFRINIMTVGGQRWILDGDVIPATGTWYGLAARSDGETLSLWLDDGSGYIQIGSLDITAQSITDNALASSALNWTFGRGWYNGGFVDHIAGKMDNIRFSDTALPPSEMIALNPAASTSIPTVHLTYTNGTATVSLVTLMNRSYQLQTSPTLDPDSWTSLGEPHPGDGTEQTFTHSPGEARSFYRVLVTP